VGTVCGPQPPCGTGTHTTPLLWVALVPMEVLVSSVWACSSLQLDRICPCDGCFLLSLSLFIQVIGIYSFSLRLFLSCPYFWFVSFSLSLSLLRPAVRPNYRLFVERSVNPINNPAQPHWPLPTVHTTRAQNQNNDQHELIVPLLTTNAP